MSADEDMARIAQQEAALVFQRFDADVAFDIGLTLKALAEERKTGLSIDIRLWERQLFYYAMAGIGVTFVLNLGVSFSIASFVALRAYDVHAREQFLLVRYLLRQIVRSPLKFVFPIEREATTPVSVLTVVPEEK